MAKQNANENMKKWMDGIGKMELKRPELTKEEELRKELHEEINKLDEDILYVVAESIGLR